MAEEGLRSEYFAQPERSSGAQQNTEPVSVDVLAAQVRAGFRTKRNEHHRLCSTGQDEGCDCYARWSVPAHQALDLLVGYAKRAEELEASRPPNMQTAAERIHELKAEVASLRDALEAEQRDSQALRDVVRAHWTPLQADAIIEGALRHG